MRPVNAPLSAISAKLRARTRPDADIVAVVPCHDRTIGIRFMLAKSLQGPVVPWRNNTWRSVETAEPASPHRAAAIRLNVESKRKNASGAIPHTLPSCRFGTPARCKKQCADKHLRTKGRRITNPLYLALNAVSATRAASAWLPHATIASYTAS